MNLTKEERDQWHERLLSSYTCFDAEHATFTIRLLNALNQAEEEIARLEQEAFFWREETKDVREIFTRQLGYKDIEIARLEREADWLAHKLCEAVDALMPESLRIKFCVKTVEEAREAAREAVEEGR